MNCILGDEMGLGKTLQVSRILRPIYPTAHDVYITDAVSPCLRERAFARYAFSCLGVTSLSLPLNSTTLGAGSDPHLIICPLSVLSSWLNVSARSPWTRIADLTRIHQEAARWVPSFRALRFHGQASERIRLKNSIRDGKSGFDLCVTTYDSFVAEHGWFKSKRWNYCVLDEGHKIKNAETGIASKLQGIGASRRLSKRTILSHIQDLMVSYSPHGNARPQ
jgi:SNF2 family DNA or RNA helicase